MCQPMTQEQPDIGVKKWEIIFTLSLLKISLLKTI